jgi:hypothetical protein
MLPARLPAQAALCSGRLGGTCADELRALKEVHGCRGDSAESARRPDVRRVCVVMGDTKPSQIA